MIDLTKRYNDFAVYLPALQKSYALAVANAKAPKNRPFPKGITMRDLDFSIPKASYGTTATPCTQLDNLLTLHLLDVL